jgi:hypothetical protein
VTPALGSALRGAAQEVVGCFNKLLRRAEVSGEGHVEVQVNEDGQICRVGVELDAPLAPMESCVRSHFERVRTPAPDGGCLTVRIPLSFSIKDPAANNGALAQSDVFPVVARNSAGLKRACFLPALAAGSAAGAVTARLKAALTIAPSGKVWNVTVTGAESELPSLAPCVAAAVKAWTFPQAPGTTSIDVPLVCMGP